MDFSFTEEQEKLRKEIHDYMLERIPADYCIDVSIKGKRLREWTYKLQKDLGEKGWLCLGWPKEYGGGGQGHIEVGIVSEEIHMGMPNYVAYHMAAPAVLLFGTEEQKKKYLPPITRGEYRMDASFYRT